MWECLLTGDVGNMKGSGGLRAPGLVTFQPGQSERLLFGVCQVLAVTPRVTETGAKREDGLVQTELSPASQVAGRQRRSRNRFTSRTP